MALELTGTIKITVSTEFKEELDLVTPAEALSYTKTIPIANGVGSGQANMQWSDERTLAAATAEDLDLAGVLTDFRGNTITFTKIKAILIENLSTTPGDVLKVGGDVNGLVNWVDDATDILCVDPGAVELITSMIDGFAVTAATGDILQIDNPGANSVDYKIIIIGTV